MKIKRSYKARQRTKPTLSEQDAKKFLRPGTAREKLDEISRNIVMLQNVVMGDVFYLGGNDYVITYPPVPYGESQVTIKFAAAMDDVVQHSLTLPAWFPMAVSRG